MLRVAHLVLLGIVKNLPADIDQVTLVRLRLQLLHQVLQLRDEKSFKPEMFNSNTVHGSWKALIT